VQKRYAAVGDHVAFAVVGVLAILACVVFAIETPGVLLVLVILAAPALVRAGLASFPRLRENAPVGNQESESSSQESFLRVFLSSVGVAALVGYISFNAFWIAFLVACFPALAVSIASESMSWFLAITIGTGALFALLVAGLLLWAFWKRKWM
jgi:hypothetical protein